jgi:AcrR family transcriptional regulator
MLDRSRDTSPAVPSIVHAPPTRPRRSDFQRTRERIVEAARRLMGERGPESLTVSAVAHAAGINRTTAYQHFRTRDQLVGAVTEELIEEVGAYLATRRPIVEHIDAIAAYFVEHPELARLAIYWLLSETPIPRAGMELFHQETRRIIEDGGALDDADPEMLGHLMMGVAVLWPLHARIEFEDADARRAATARLAREFKRVLLYGLLRPEQWPHLVTEVSREPAPTARRPRRNP